MIWFVFFKWANQNNRNVHMHTSLQIHHLYICQQSNKMMFNRCYSGHECYELSLSKATSNPSILYSTLFVLNLMNISKVISITNAQNNKNCSILHVLVDTVIPFNVVMRKYIAGFSKQFDSCENVIVKTLYNGMGFQNSKLFNVWCRNACSLKYNHMMHL